MICSILLKRGFYSTTRFTEANFYMIVTFALYLIEEDIRDILTGSNSF